jgi:hypothetical protein
MDFSRPMVSTYWTPDSAALVTGLALILGAVLAWLIARHAQPRSFWACLAAFGLAQGCYQWLVPCSNPASTAGNVLQVVLLVGSLISLFEAGRAQLAGKYPQLGRWSVLPLVAIAGLGMLSGTIAGIKAGIWLAVGLPAALLVALNLVRMARAAARRDRIAIYIIAAGLMIFILAQVSPSAHALAATLFLAGHWLLARAWLPLCERTSWLARWPLPLVFALTVVVACWALSTPGLINDAESLDFAEIELDELDLEEQPDSLTYDRWRIAAPMMALIVILPAGVAVAYWLRLAQ